MSLRLARRADPLRPDVDCARRVADSGGRDSARRAAMAFDTEDRSSACSASRLDKCEMSGATSANRRSALVSRTFSRASVDRFAEAEEEEDAEPLRPPLTEGTLSKGADTCSALIVAMESLCNRYSA